MPLPIPVHLSTTIGDALHNLRSALDCAAYEMARRHVGRDLTEDEELACEFPIRDDPDKLDRFFSGSRSCVRERRQSLTTPLWLLARLSNIDKHRRLHLTAWWPDIVYWGSDEPSHCRWRWGAPPYEDGRILGRLIHDSRHPEPPATLHQEMTLRILYPGAESQDIVRLLKGIHEDMTYRVMPRLLDPSRRAP